MGKTGAASPDLVVEHPVPDRTTGGNHVPAFRAQVRQGPASDAPGRSFAAGGPLRRPHERRCPGPLPTPPTTSAWSTATGRWWSGRRRAASWPAPSSAARPTSSTTPSATPTPASGSPTPTGSRAARRGWPRVGVHLRVPGPGRAARPSPRESFLLALAVPRAGGGHHVFHALIPVHQPKGLWDKVLGALDPDRWARSGAQVGDPGSPRDFVRRGGAGGPGGSRRVRGGVGV